MYYVDVVVSLKRGFSSYFSFLINVYFRKILGHTANIKNIDTNAIGSIPILSAKSTSSGAKKHPNKLNASIIPTAVD